MLVELVCLAGQCHGRLAAATSGEALDVWGRGSMCPLFSHGGDGAVSGEQACPSNQTQWTPSSCDVTFPLISYKFKFFFLVISGFHTRTKPSEIRSC